MTTSTAVSVAEYFDLLHESEQKLDYHDGEIVAMWGGQPKHNLIASNLIAEFVIYLKKQAVLFSTAINSSPSSRTGFTYFPI